MSKTKIKLNDYPLYDRLMKKVNLIEITNQKFREAVDIMNNNRSESYKEHLEIITSLILHHEFLTKPDSLKSLKFEILSRVPNGTVSTFRTKTDPVIKKIVYLYYLENFQE